MAYQVLARKYRPQRFSDVAGQDHVTRTLGNALEQERVAHGYIFSGHRGIGKTTIARILAMALNCRNKIGSPERPSFEPCAVCDSCKEIRAGNSLDVVEIDAATNRGIDEIRELRDAARYAPARDRYKIYLLDEAHQITDAAFNALLKTLEEPPEHVVFMTQLTQIALQEGILADPRALALLAEAGDGSMRDALSIMDQAIASAPLMEGKAKLDGEEIRELMGTVPDAVFERMLEFIGEGQSAAVMEELNRLLNNGNSPSQMARQLVRYLRNCLMAKLGGAGTELLQISGDERARAMRSAALFGEEDLTRFLQVMLRTFDELNYRQEPRLHLELGLMKLVHLQRLLPLEEILSGLPGASRPAIPRPASSGPAASRPSASAMPIPRPEPPKAKPAAPSPFEQDRQRKQEQEAEPVPETVQPEPVAVRPEPVAVAPQPEPAPVPVQPEPERSPAGAAPDLDQLRDLVVTALDDQGHNTAASLLSDGHWKLDEEGAIQVEVRAKKTMLGLTMNAQAWKIVRDALLSAGAKQKMTAVPSETGEPATASPRVFSRDSIEAVALGNPLVRHTQELFHAEVRSVVDLRDKGKG
jgi:DNA polymerase-3 subunit gamma/tau